MDRSIGWSIESVQLVADPIHENSTQVYTMSEHDDDQKSRKCKSVIIHWTLLSAKLRGNQMDRSIGWSIESVQVVAEPINENNTQVYTMSKCDDYETSRKCKSVNIH